MMQRVRARVEGLLRRATRDTALGEAAVVQRNVHRALRRLGQPALPVWYHEAYRLPLPAFEASGARLRRADFVAWCITDLQVLREDELRTPERIGYRDLARVHTQAWLEAVHTPETLARVFATTVNEASASALLESTRLACGGTLAAARCALGERRSTLNLGGGFHHAEPDKGGGYCLLNDVAVAIATLRAEGFAGRVCVLDLDAHPPEGTAECLKGDPSAWIGSISATHWGELPGVDETLLPGAGDREYLTALDALLGRMPRPDLAFVLSGGDVLDGDGHGGFRLTVEGAHARDERVAEALCDVGSVWVPAGGYHDDAWRICANTALLLAHSPAAHVPPGFDPMRRRFSRLARTLRREDLTAGLDLDLADLGAELRLPVRRARLLDFYTPEGIEHVLEHYGILEHLRRLGYGSLRVDVDCPSVGDRVRLYGRHGRREHLLVELVVERRRLEGRDVVYVHWLTLRNPVATLGEEEALPGQEVRGLGLAREFGLLLRRMAERLGLAGVAFTPSWYHMAAGSHPASRFVSPEREGRFVALQRDLGALPIAELSRAIAEGRVRCNGEPYAWEPDVMVAWLDEPSRDDERERAEAERCRFECASP